MFGIVASPPPVICTFAAEVAKNPCRRNVSPDVRGMSTKTLKSRASPGGTVKLVTTSQLHRVVVTTAAEHVLGVKSLTITFPAPSIIRTELMNVSIFWIVQVLPGRTLLNCILNLVQSPPVEEVDVKRAVSWFATPLIKGVLGVSGERRKVVCPKAGIEKITKNMKKINTFLYMTSSF